MKRILIISPTFPYPKDTGAKIRIYNTIKELSKKHQIDLMAMTIDNVTNNHISKIKEYTNDIYIYKIESSRYIPAIKTLLTKKPYRFNKFWDQEFFNKVQKKLKNNNYDIIWCNFLNMAIYLTDSHIKGSYVILDQHNADEMFWHSYLDSKNLIYKFLAKKNIANLKEIRKDYVDKFDLILSVSEKDKKFTKSWLSSNIEIYVAPNGVDIDYFNSKNNKDTNGKNIIFCGSMDVTMNIEAVKDFVKHVFPQIKQKLPEVKFWIVGRNPTESICNLENESIIVTGTVDDVRPYYNKAKVSIAPFKYGGGTKLKVTESLSMQVPMVSTKIGAQGIKVVDGEHILIEDDWKEFADAVIKLFEDKELYNMMSLKGRKFVEKHYSWKGIINNLQNKYTEIF